MSASEYAFSEEPPSIVEFNALRQSVAWPPVDEGLVVNAFRASRYLIVVRHNHNLIGMARVVGDGAMYYYIQDFMIMPSHQGLGLGDQLMQKVNEYLQAHTQPGATIGLMAAAGKESFYQRYGFIERTGDPWGRGMCKFV